MSRNFLKEFQQKLKTLEAPEIVEAPIVIPVEIGTIDTFTVVRRTLPTSNDIPLFFNCSLHEAKDLVFRVLKARVINHHGSHHAQYYDWVKEEAI